MRGHLRRSLKDSGSFRGSVEADQCSSEDRTRYFGTQEFMLICCSAAQSAFLLILIIDSNLSLKILGHGVETRLMKRPLVSWFPYKLDSYLM